MVSTWIFNMEINIINNTDVNQKLQASIDELDNIINIIDSLGQISRPSPYLSKYAIILASGTIESCFKIIIADFLLLHTTNESLSSFINNAIRETSKNPSYQNIINVLKGINRELSQKFKDKVGELEHKEQILSALESLVENRNSLAHGGSPTTTASQVKNHFEYAIKVLIVLEEVCS